MAVDSSLMPLNETDKAWIRTEIQAGHKRAGLGVLTGFIKDWSGTGAAITILVVFFTQWTAYTEFRVHTADRLDAIESSLRTIQASSAPKKVLGELASLTPANLAKNLSALRVVAEQPVEEVRPSKANLHAISQDLLRIDSKTPDYWPAVLQFVNFATSASSPNVPPRGSQVNAFISDSGGMVIPPHGVYQLAGRISNIKFVNSRIIFSPQGATLTGVLFTNCVFEFPNELEDPQGNLKAVGRTLLASDFKEAYVSGL